MRKQFIRYQDFETLLIQANYTEVDFLAHAKLGVYTVREWKRIGEAPAWAGEFLLLVAKARLAPEPNLASTIDPVEAAMTPSELEEYYQANKVRMQEIYDAVKARMA